MTYTVQVAADVGFTNIKYQREELDDTWQFLGDCRGPVRPDDLLLARAGRGRVRRDLATSPTWSFQTNNTNLTLPAFVSGVVTDKIPAPVIADATVIISSPGTAQTTDAAGKYVQPLDAGATMTISASKAGYTSSLPVSVTAVSGAERVANISLVPDNPVPHTLLVTKTGSGTVTSSTSGISCGVELHRDL